MKYFALRCNSTVTAIGYRLFLEHAQEWEGAGVLEGGHHLFCFGRFLRGACSFAPPYFALLPSLVCYLNPVWFDLASPDPLRTLCLAFRLLCGSSQEYGAHVPLSVLDADTTTLRSLVPIIKAEGRGREGAPATGPSGEGAATAAGGAVVAGVASSQTMVREPTGK